jgi:PKHD-type hydroxylase
MSAAPLYWLWKKQLPIEQIKILNKIIMKKYEMVEPVEYAAKDLYDNNTKKNTKTYIVHYKYIKKYIENLVQKAFAINKYNFNYDVYNLSDGYTCNYNVYKDSTLANYDWHIDGTKDPYRDIKLTFIINLSEKLYEGGTFMLEHNNTFEINNFNEPGDMILFISRTRHKVTPVTKGIRKNITLFFDGPAFK